MRKTIKLACTILVISLGMVLVGCAKNDDPKPPDAAQSDAARVAMVDWLECEECEEGQLENVLKYRAQLEPLLISTLHKGVAPANRELYKRELEKRYDELVAYSKTHPQGKPTSSKEEFVNLYLDNLTAQYQTRAAQALAAIGGDKSRQALQTALAEQKREDVKAVINQALREIK
jgi:hypothetical protein